MFKAIGFVIGLLAISHIMTEPFEAFMNAASATFHTIEVAAQISEQQLVKSVK